MSMSIARHILRALSPDELAVAVHRGFIPLCDVPIRKRIRVGRLVRSKGHSFNRALEAVSVADDFYNDPVDSMFMTLDATGRETPVSKLAQRYYNTLSLSKRN